MTALNAVGSPAFRGIARIPQATGPGDCSVASETLHWKRVRHWV